MTKDGRFAFGNRSGGPSDLSRQVASQPCRRSSTIAGDLFLLALLFLFIFGLPGLFAGV